jgi:aromatic ring-opening dioxygenase catalytic subunit (LigB family)
LADLIGVLGVTHNPLMWAGLQGPIPDDLVRVADNFWRFRSIVSDLAPDVIVLVASDHFHMLMTANMPAFMLGKAPVMRAGFPNEARQFGLRPTQVTGDPELAAYLLGGRNLAPGIDFAFSDEPWLDHSFLVPLLLLIPKLDIPVVPVFTNCNAPPIPTAARFAELGVYLGEAIRASGDDRRVLVVGSGHLAHELGGPRQFLGTSPDPDFDQEAVGWMADGRLEEAIATASFDRLTKAGNESYQFLNFVSCLALVGGAPAAFAEGTATRFGALPFFYWDLPSVGTSSTD